MIDARSIRDVLTFGHSLNLSPPRGERLSSRPAFSRALPLALLLGVATIAPAAADPRALPTVPYIVDMEVTRPADFAVNFPARFVYAGQRLRVDFGPLSKLVDLDRRETTIMIPRVRTYWWPQKINDGADGRRWVGVEAETADAVGQDVILGQRVTRYRVRGTIFDTRTPFEGDVWTTRDNIVLKVDGTGRGEDGVAAPIRMNPVQLVVAEPDPSLLVVPPKFGRARKSDVSWRDGD